MQNVNKLIENIRTTFAENEATSKAWSAAHSKAVEHLIIIKNGRRFIGGGAEAYRAAAHTPELQAVLDASHAASRAHDAALKAVVELGETRLAVNTYAKVWRAREWLEEKFPVRDSILAANLRGGPNDIFDRYIVDGDIYVDMCMQTTTDRCGRYPCHVTLFGNKEKAAALVKEFKALLKKEKKVQEA